MTCGDPCKELTDLQRRFHLLKLAEEAKPKADQLPAFKLYLQAGGGATTEASAMAQASKMMADDRVVEALHWHRRQGAKRVELDRQKIAEMLLPLAAVGRLRTADLVTVRARPQVTREELTRALEFEDDGDRAKWLRQLLQVQILPWEGEDAIDPELTRGVSVEERADGTLKITPPPLSASLNAIAQLRTMYGFDEKSDEAGALERIGGQLAELVRAVLGAEAADKLEDAIGAEPGDDQKPGVS